MDQLAVDHSEAWDLAHVREGESNLARCYIELRKAAADAVKTYYYGGKPFRETMEALAAICKTNED